MNVVSATQSMFATQYLAHHARRQPEAVAVVYGDVVLTYRQFAARVLQYIRALQDMQIAPGTLVGIECSDPLVHLHLLLACANIGAATTPLIRDDLQPDNPLYRRCDVVFAQAVATLPQGPRAQFITPRWVAGIESRSPLPGDLSVLDAPPDPQALALVTRTSGATGRPKVMAVSHALTHDLVAQYGTHPSEHIPSPLRFILMYTPAARFACNRIFMCIKMGGLVILSSRRTFIADIERHAANYSILLVGDAEKLVAQLPPSFRKPPLFGVVPAGAALSPRLRKALLDKLASHVVEIYTSNETGRICVKDADGIGWVHPGVSVAIVDEDGRDLPYGETGLIKVKSPAMVAGYLGNPELSASTFIDGWFHSNDMGRMPAPNRLIVFGRADDLLNIGGLKIAPGPIEDELKAVPGVRDAAVVEVSGSLGGSTLAFAIERTPGAGSEGLKAAITQAVGQRYTRFHLMILDALPRTENGKIRRRDVEESFRRGLGLSV